MARIGAVGEITRQLGGYHNVPTIQQHTKEMAKRFPELHPKSDSFFFNDGSEEELLKLEGTIPIYYHRNRYNIPVGIWIQKDYPSSSPICFVQPTKDMKIKKNHPSVDGQGMVFIPYITSWGKRSELTGLIDEMSARFSEAPPLFRKSKKPKPKPRRQSREIVREEHNPVRADNGYGNGSVEDQIRNAINVKIQERLNDLSQTALVEVNDLLKSQSKLNDGAAQLKAGVSEWNDDKERVNRELEEIQRKCVELEGWLQTNEEKAAEMDLSIDDLLIPQDSWSDQVVDSVAQDHAIDDALYALDGAVVNGAIEIDQFLREVRKLARKQFFARALAQKIAHKQEALYMH